MTERKPTPQEIQDENRNIRKLRLMVDLSLLAISQGAITRADALAQFDEVRRFALSLFPGKEEEFDIIYAPKFLRMIREIYGLD